MGYLEDIREKVSQLENEVNGISLEREIIQNELIEVVNPSLAIGLINITLLEIQMELYAYVRKKGGKWTTELTKSKTRLEGLVSAVELVNGITDTNISLKDINKKLHTNYQLLRIENMELKKKLKNIQDAHEY